MFIEHEHSSDKAPAGRHVYSNPDCYALKIHRFPVKARGIECFAPSERYVYSLLILLMPGSSFESRSYQGEAQCVQQSVPNPNLLKHQRCDMYIVIRIAMH